MLHPHPQQIAAARQVGHTVTRDHRLTLLVDERFERDQAQVAVGGDQESTRVAVVLRERSQDTDIQAGCKPGGVGAVRIAPLTMRGHDLVVKSLCISEIDPTRHARLPDDIRRVVRRTIRVDRAFGGWIERSEHTELNERRIVRYRRLH